MDGNQLSLLTVRQFAEKNPAFSEGSLRWLIFNAKNRVGSKGLIPGNGLDAAIVRVGRRVLIDEKAFSRWLLAQKSEGGTGASPANGVGGWPK